jgi:NodT family efflux transporter outer membrane factor (OMF) lipoprotein
MPAIPVPDAYSEAIPVVNPQVAATVPEGSDGAWWRTLGSAELDALIDRGLANNPDMRIAVQHIVQAKARLDQARAGRRPTVSAPLVIGDQSAGAGSVGAAPPGGGSNGGSQKTWQAGIRADWRLDLWGEQSALAESARFQMQRAIHERDNVARNLVGAIANSYVEFLALNDRKRIAERTDAVQSATLTSIEARVKAGDATMADLEQQRAAIFSVRATLPVLEQQRVDTLANLAFLVGTVPGRLRLGEAGLDALHRPAPVTGLPSELLLRRPDVRMAEAQLRSARADISVARARLLPPLDLAAQIGRSAANPAQLLLPQTLFWSVVESLTISLFDGQRRENDEVVSRAIEEEMVEGYVRAIHQAIREVEGALATLRLSGDRLAAEQETLDAAKRAWDISTRIYKIGGVDYLTLLDTQRTYHHYLDEFQQARVGDFRAHIALFQALGGDTRVPSAPTAGKARSEGTHGPARTPDAAAASAAISGACLAGIPGDDGHPAAGGDWQVELTGTYHCATVASAWRDLLGRYPNSMQGRVLRPTLAGRVDDAQDSEQSWFRLAVSRFTTAAEAQAFCRALQSDQLRCAVTATPAARTLGSTLAQGNPSGSSAGHTPTPPDTPGLEISALEETPAGVAARSSPLAGAATDSRSGLAAEGRGPQNADSGLEVPDRLGSPAGATTRPDSRPAVDRSAARSSSGRYLQLGAFRDPVRAEAMRSRASEALRTLGGNVQLKREGPLTLVWAGPYLDPQGERAASARLRDLTGSEPRSVRGTLASGDGTD